MEFLKRFGDALLLLVRSLFDPLSLLLDVVFVAPLIYVGAARGEPTSTTALVFSDVRGDGDSAVPKGAPRAQDRAPEGRRSMSKG